MPDLTDPMEGVTVETVTVPVTTGQYALLEKDRVLPGRPRVTHQIQVGPYYLPGRYVVVATQRTPERCQVVLARLED